MASGFVILKDGRCFARRWSSYDALIQLVIDQLAYIEQGASLAAWLALQIPTLEEEEVDAGYGFYNKRTEDWVNRSLDLRSLTPNNQTLFWLAIQRANQQLVEGKEKAFLLSTDLLRLFCTMGALAEKGAPPLELSDWNALAAPCKEQHGPGWLS